PFGIKKIEQKFNGGFGVMVDDILAGLYANVLTGMVVILY
ncbi:MAG: phosphatidylglycerophosphatase A, partial [Flavobacteriales bacterium]